MEQQRINENRIDNMLKQAYRHENVPESVNIRLRNQLKCKEAITEKSISVWWLPALLSTVIAVAGFVIAFILYLIVNLSGDFIMPNLVHVVSTSFIKLEWIGMAVQIAISWLVTIIGLWKMNFYHNAHIF